MKSQSLVSKPTRAAIVFFLILAGVTMVQARTAKDFFQNSELSDGNNYSPAGTPTAANDVRLTTPTTVLTLNGTTLNVGSVNQTNNLSYTIANNNSGTANSTLELGGGGDNAISPNPNDVIYFGCPSCSLTFQGPNASDDGIGVLKLIQNGGAQCNVAQSGATVNIASDLLIDGSLTKIGSGTLNFSNDTITTSGFATLTVNEGIENNKNITFGRIKARPNIFRLRNPRSSDQADVTIRVKRLDALHLIGRPISRLIVTKDNLRSLAQLRDTPNCVLDVTSLIFAGDHNRNSYILPTTRGWATLAT